MKLFVWNNTFCDYTPGVAFAFASTVGEAKELIVAQALREEAAYRKRCAETLADEGATLMPVTRKVLQGSVDNKERGERAAVSNTLHTLQMAEEVGDFHVYTTAHGEYILGGG